MMRFEKKVILCWQHRHHQFDLIDIDGKDLVHKVVLTYEPLPFFVPAFCNTTSRIIHLVVLVVTHITSECIVIVLPTSSPEPLLPGLGRKEWLLFDAFYSKVRRRGEPS